MASVRDRLLRAGVDLFHSQGYAATGVQQIATQAGVPKGSFYNHFASKETLAVAALHDYARTMPIAMLGDRRPSAGQAVRDHFDALRERFVASGFTRGCLIGNLSVELADREPAVRDVLRELFAGWTQLLATALAEARDGGEAAPSLDPVRAAGGLLDGWEGALVRSRALGQPDPLDDFRDSVLASVLPPGLVEGAA